ncbi:MAG: hypothetical protein M3Y48_01215 [Actinomycetota bacterium]|nr:hypothetical protein [Actinomycetota bacterium]
MIVFETHSWSEDNDRGVATGWLPGRLSERGRELARQLGARRRDDGLARLLHTLPATQQRLADLGVRSTSHA